MAKKEFTTSVGKIGMNRDGHISALRQEEYAFAKNTNVVEGFLQSEHSNILTAHKPGYKVIGLKNHNNKDITYFFLTNPVTGFSEVASITNIQEIENEEDLQLDCGDCDIRNVLSEPLEDQVQTPTHTYTTILEDSCNGCLNFSIDHPIFYIIVKEEVTGTKIYWTDNYNPQRHIDLDRLLEYGYTGEIICGEDETVPTCLDCEKLRMYQNSQPARLIPEELQTGGTLRRGTYEFAIVYCNKEGVELSEYHSHTQPVHVFDRENNILSQTELSDRTGYAIKLKVTNLDKKFHHYKVVVTMTTDQSTSYYVEGIHNITDHTILFTTEDNKIRFDINTLNQVRPIYTKSEILAESSNKLYQGNVAQAPQWNLQPVVNFMGAFAKWLTIEASEKLYQNGVLSAKYKTRMRDEVYPKGIRFKTNAQYTTPIYPLISRPARTSETEEVDNDETESVLRNSIGCTSTERNKRWQFYNTATNDGRLDTYESSGILVHRPASKYCIQEDVGVIPGTDQELIINLEEFEEYTDLESFVNDNFEYIYYYNGSDETMLLLQTYLTQTYPDCPDIATLFPDTCEAPEKEGEAEISINGVEGEVAMYIEKVLANYIPTAPPDYCYIYEYGDDGEVVQDERIDLLIPNRWLDPITTTETLFLGLRISTEFQEKCNYAQEIVHKVDKSIIGEAYHLPIYGTLPETEPGAGDAITLDDLYDKSYTLTANTADGWYDGLHKGAIWFKGFIQGAETRFVLDMTPLTKTPWYERPQNGETFARRLDIVRQIQSVLEIESSLRVSIWDNCSSRDPFTPAQSFVIGKNDGLFKLFDIEDTSDPNYLNITGGSFLVSVEAPILNSVSFARDIETDIYLTAAPWECFSIFTRPIEYSEVRVTFDSIGLDKSQKYVASCEYSVPQPNDCAPQSFETGDFSYWESLEIYPDNPQLYNSSKIEIAVEDIPESARPDFEEFYGTVASENYRLRDSDFTCKPIRHFKYPDNVISPFITPIEVAPFSEAIIYPIGMTIDENVVNSFLDIAVKNSLIDQKDRDSIVGYEIMYGNRVGNKSIQAKGIVYDSMGYTEKGKKVEYSNFPFNDLGKNKYFKDVDDKFLDHPYGGEKNNKFMFMSPDIYSGMQLNPTEVNIEAYMFGDSSNTITEVKDHPKWIILGKDAKKTATKLAVIEGVIEVALGLTESMEVFRLDFGFVVSLNIAGIILYILRAVAVIANAFIKVGQYRLQWLRTIRDLGTPYNFAARNTGVATYNHILNEHEPLQRLRGISGIGKIKSGISNITDKQGKISHINNIDRESSLYISFGYDATNRPYHVEYPNQYIGYDNNKRNYSSSSRFLAGEENCPNGKSEEFIKNAASPYFSLKNYMPEQYGTIDSVAWLTTSYNGSLNNPNPTPRIFGGDTFISRFAEIRKIPMFLTTAMNQASLTAFEYEKYSNLGVKPTYYCDYEFGSDTNFGAILFPDIDSKYNFDCLRGQNGFYIKPPAKFYLYSHGIASYMVESEINCNNRYAKEGLLSSFYPQEQDYIRLTEQVERPIRTQEEFYYNNAYSKTVERHPYTILPSTYDRDLYERIAKGDGTIIASDPDNNEYGFSDPWLVNRPNNYFKFKSSNGKLISLDTIESEQILARFEKAFTLMNALDNSERMTPETVVAGTDGVLNQRMIDFGTTDLGYGGTQNKAIIHCEYGHVWADAERGQVFLVPTGGNGLEEISKAVGKQATNMKRWFKKHLPFKIKNSGIENINVDNPFKGIGITMGWDSRYERIFLTKRDYKLVNKQSDLCYNDGKFYNTSSEIIDPIIAQYEEDNYVYDGIENCKLKFKKTTKIPVEANIYAFFDCTSMQLYDAIVLKDVLLVWFANYQAQHPAYTGNFYILPVATNTTDVEYEQYLLHPISLIAGNPTLATDPAYLALAILPPDLNTPQWVAEKNAVSISFVDEVQPQYHDDIRNNFTGQPTAIFETDYLNYKNSYEEFDYLKCILYPVPQPGNSTGNGGQQKTQNFVLQAMAAIEGKILTPGELTFFNPQVDVTAILSSNPYKDYVMPDSSIYVPLKALKWVGVYDKISPASEVFTSETFEEELDGYIEQGETMETLYVDLPEVELTDTSYFKDVSWTISFNFLTGRWGSYFDFKPNYYLAQNNYFQTGINYSTNNDPTEEGLWSHLLTNRSYQVFYGKAYDWEIEVPVENKGSKRFLEYTSYIMESLRYHNDYDYSETQNVAFSEMFMYNNTNISGKLILDPQKSITQISKYPITEGNEQQRILQVNNEGVWNINYFYNRTKDQNNNVPLFNYDDNEIEKHINQQAVSFYGKKVLERMRGQEFLINYKAKDTQHKKMFRLGYTKETQYLE